ncbi:MAG: excinuclease ABC subunit UvrC [Bacilli bacterium]
MKEKLKLVPEKPGCYLMKNKDGLIIYVGKAKNLKRRVNSYFNKIQTGKTKVLVSQITDFEYIVTNSETESLILEINLIKRYNPKYNILLKDDKTYPYIVLTNDKYPSLKIVRSKSRKKIKGKVFGPFPGVMSAKNTVNLINRIYPLKKCDKLKKKVCLYYHINECLGYCEKEVSKEIINSMIEDITKILNGDYKFLTKKLEEAMEKASENLEYEKALEIKNLIEDIETTISKQIIVSNIKYNFDVFGFYEIDNFLAIETVFIRDGVVIGKVNKIINDYLDRNDAYIRYIIDFYDKFPLPKKIIVNDIPEVKMLESILDIAVQIPKKGDIKKILNMANVNAEISSKEKIERIRKDDLIRYESIEDLKRILSLKKLERIELFDNSHLFGTYYVGAMVVFKDFLPDRNEYRKYKIDSHTKDDLTAMKEVIYRRYQKALLEKTQLPDLIIVDGGSLQISATKEVLDSLKLDIPLIGLKKDKSHKTSKLVLSNLTEIDIKNKNLFVYLYKMQEEVHRFAITYHRNIKNKGMLQSILEDVPGIGEKRRKELLKKYSSLSKIKTASVEELSEIIPEEVAKSLLEFLNKKEEKQK